VAIKLKWKRENHVSKMAYRTDMPTHTQNMKRNMCTHTHVRAMWDAQD